VEGKCHSQLCNDTGNEVSSAGSARRPGCSLTLPDGGALTHPQLVRRALELDSRHSSCLSGVQPEEFVCCSDGNDGHCFGAASQGWERSLSGVDRV
jgi:hypothetical protein